MSDAGAVHLRLEDLPEDVPRPQMRRRRVIGERMMLSEVFVEKGCDAPVHQHENEQFLVLLAGRMRLTVGDGAGGTREVVVEAGDVMHFPPNVPHGGVALEDCRILDVFSPTSETTGIDQD